jgi:hypothetical protein
MLAQVDYIPDSLLVAVDTPWWERALYNDQNIRVRGVPLPSIVEQLKLIYDEPTCQDMTLRGHWAPLLGLFFGTPALEWFGVMLSLGADLCELDDNALMLLAPRLRSGDQWWGARVESGVAAGLIRCGRVPLRPDLHKDHKQWDYTVVLDGVTYLIECKALSSGDDDGNLEQLEQRFQGLIVEFGLSPPCDATLQLSTGMLAEIEKQRTQLFHECVLPEFTEELRRTFRRAALDGTPRHVGRFGMLTLVPSVRDNGFLGRWVVTGHQRAPIHRFRRVVNTFADAARSFELAPTGNHRVAVVWTGRNYMSASLSALALANLDRVVEADHTRVSLARDRFGFETGVVIDACHRRFGRGFEMAGDQFHVRGDLSRLSRVIYSGVRGWDYHLTIDD